VTKTRRELFGKLDQAKTQEDFVAADAVQPDAAVLISPALTPELPAQGQLQLLESIAGIGKISGALIISALKFRPWIDDDHEAKTRSTC